MGDRPQFQTQVNEEVIPILLRHLESIGEQNNIDLFLYTRGGDMVVPIRIVQLIRTYCKEKFSVLVPYRCLSAGTLICLGADEIVMTKIAELTPVDPTASIHPFNPRVNAMPGQNPYLPISVEDVRSYLKFAEDELDASVDQVVDLYAKMTEPSPNNLHLHPLSLGNVYRVQRMIKIITQRLLETHIKPINKTNEVRISKIIDAITEDICIHNYPIYRDEAREIGLDIKTDKKEEKLILDLFELYSTEMKLESHFNPLEELGANDIHSGNYYGSYIESMKSLNVFNFTYEIKKLTQPVTPGSPLVPQVSINLNFLKNQWEKIR